MKNLLTIGFTQKSAKQFFNILQKNKIDLIADVRLNNKGQLAGFTKERDFKFFLSLFNIQFTHLIDFAPTKILRKAYHSDWDFKTYKKKYIELLRSRNAVHNFIKSYSHYDNLCLLCSEPKADKCHRSLAAAEIIEQYKRLTLTHL